MVLRIQGSHRAFNIDSEVRSNWKWTKLSELSPIVNCSPLIFPSLSLFSINWFDKDNARTTLHFTLHTAIIDMLCVYTHTPRLYSSIILVMLLYVRLLPLTKPHDWLISLVQVQSLCAFKFLIILPILMSWVHIHRGMCIFSGKDQTPVSYPWMQLFV
jgi:hypothetical protein